MTKPPDLTRIGQGPDAAVLPSVDTPSDPQYYDKQLGSETPVSYWDRFKNRMSETSKNLFTTQILGQIQLNDLENKGGPKVDPRTLNKQFPGLEIPFSEPTSLDVAQEIARRAQEKRELQNVDQLGPQGGVAGASIWTAGALAGIADPAFLLGAPLMEGMLGAAGATGIGRFLTETPVVSQFVHAAVTQAPLSAIGGYIKNQEHQDYSLSDYGSELIHAGIAGAGLHATFHWALPKAAQFLRYGAERAGLLAERTAISQAALDRPINVDPIVNDAAAERMGSQPRGGVSNLPRYEYTPIDEQTKLGSRVFYNGTPDSRGDFASARKIPIESDFGDGVYLTDHPGVANGSAASKYEPTEGRIYQAQIPEDAKLLDLEKPLTGELRQALSPFLPEGGAELTGHQALEQIKERMAQGELPGDSYAAVQAKLADAGYDGYRSQGGKFLGMEGDAHNIVQMFDPQNTGDAGGKVTPIQAFSPDPTSVPQLAPEAAQQLRDQQNSPRNHFLFDAKEYSDFEARLNGREPHIPDAKTVEKEVGDLTEMVKGLDEQGLLGKEGARVLGLVSDDVKRQAVQEKIFKAGTFCLGRDI